MNNMGIWIDHRRAVIVSKRGEAEAIDILLSNVEKHLERTGDSPLQGPYEAQQVPADDKRQRALTQHLNRFYDAVISKVASADSLLIFGPGEAKGELKRRLDQKSPRLHVAAVETTDKLTDRQIGAKVRQYFEHA